MYTIKVYVIICLLIYLYVSFSEKAALCLVLFDGLAV